MSQACKMRFLSFNYVFQSNVALSASSSNANFPVSNVGQIFRSQIWRSSGTFIIDATNNKINFVEVSAGPELTATLTAGTFTPTTLADEIKTQLEAVSVETYTVTFSTVTGRWTIATGGIFLSLLWGTGTDIANHVGPSIGYAVTDQTGATTYTGASIAIHTEESVTIDIKTAENIDSFCLFFDPELGVNFSGQAVIKLQANATDEWSAPSVDVTLAIDDREKSITHFFATVQHFRYWRIKMVDTENINLSVELGVVFLSEAKILERNLEKGFTFNRRDTSRVRTNQFGNSYTDELPFIKSMVFDLALFPKEDLALLEDVYRDVGVKKPLVVAVDPTEVVFDKDRFLIYGKFTRQLSAKHVFSKYFDSSFRILETM